MVNHNCCFIDKQFFDDNSELTHILDSDDPNKQCNRTYTFVTVDTNHLKFFIPLRNNLGAPVRKYGRIGHPIPSQKRPNAGLDYRHAILVPSQYVKPHQNGVLPNSQCILLRKHYRAIKSEFSAYVRKYINAVNKGRLERDSLFADSSLVNYNEQLGIAHFNPNVETKVISIEEEPA